MKWIFYMLVVMNLAYLAFNLRTGEPESVQVTGEEPPGSGLAGIELLSERREFSERELEQKAVLENPVLVVEPSAPIRAQSGVEEIPGVPQCQGLGVFPDLVSATDVAERLNGLELPVQVRAVDSPTGEFDYRVVMPPLPSLQEAFRRLRELKSRNIDSYVITEGEFAQGISLGVFSVRAGAVDHQQDLAAEGYDARVTEIPRVNREYWVHADPGVALPEYQVTALQDEIPGLTLLISDCLN